MLTKGKKNRINGKVKILKKERNALEIWESLVAFRIHAVVSEKSEITDALTYDGRTTDACATAAVLLTKSSRAKMVPST